jgi:hypothetical protein
VINYASSPSITRSFCGKCGTNLLYVSESRDEVKTMDLALGSLETESLEIEGVRPEWGGVGEGVGEGGG